MRFLADVGGRRLRLTVVLRPSVDLSVGTAKGRARDIVADLSRAMGLAGRDGRGHPPLGGVLSVPRLDQPNKVAVLTNFLDRDQFFECPSPSVFDRIGLRPLLAKA
jgi:hypothetical protein